MLQEPKSDFDFSQITLGPPNGLQGGSYFTKLLIKDEPLYLQIPKCTTKQGLVITEKKKYCDLMFSRDAVDVVSWFENIERQVQQLMYSKKSIWFHDDLEFSDIENAFTSPIRSYKSGNYYLVRCVIPKVITPETISCFNENEEPIDLAEINEENVEIIPLVELQGVRFSSKNFQIEIGLRQLMVIKKKDLFKKCLIRMKEVEEEPLNEVSLAKPVEEVKEIETIQLEDEEPHEEPQNEEPHEELQNEEPHEEPQNEESTEKETKGNIAIEPQPVEAQPVETQPVEVSLEELTVDGEDENLTLKNPNQVYYNMWREARQKARQAKQEALSAYLEAKKIKENYMLEGINSDSEDEDTENLLHLA